MESIEFRNYYSDIITEEIALRSSHYSVLKRNAGVRVIETFYEDGKIVQIDYYTNDSNLEAEIKTQHAGIYLNIYVLELQHNGWRKYDVKEFNEEGIQIGHRTEVFNSFDLVSYKSYYDMNSNSKIRSVKYAYDSFQEREYEFHFLANGILKYINITRHGIHSISFPTCDFLQDTTAFKVF